MQNPSRNGISDDPEFAEIHWVARLAYIIIGILMIVIAVAGNSLFLFVLYKHYKSTPANHIIFLANLCLGDLVIMAYWYPFYVVELILNRGRVLSDTHCVINGVTIMTLYMLSILSLLLIAVNRYLRVCQSNVYKRVFTMSHTWALIVGVWLGSLLFALLPIIDGMESTSYGYDPVGRSCSLNREAFSYPVVLMVLFATLPMLCIAYCNFAIFRYWRQASIPKRGASAELISDRGKDFSNRKTEGVFEWKPQPKESKSETSMCRPTICIDSDNVELSAIEPVLESVVLQDMTQASTMDTFGSCATGGVTNMFGAGMDLLVINSSQSLPKERETYAMDSNEQGEEDTDREDLQDALAEVFGHEHHHFKEKKLLTIAPAQTPAPSLASPPVTSSVSRGRQDNKLQLPVTLRPALDVSDVTAQLHEIHAKVKARELAFTRSLFVVFILAVCTYIPYDVIVIAGYFVSLPPEVSMLGNLLLFLNSCLNWAIYGAMNPGLNRGCRFYVKRLLACRRRGKTTASRTFTMTSVAD